MDGSKHATDFLSLSLSAKYRKAYFSLHNMLVDTNTSHCTQQVNQTRRPNFFSAHSHSFSTHTTCTKKYFRFFFWFHPKNVWMLIWHGMATLFFIVSLFSCVLQKNLSFFRYFSCFKPEPITLHFLSLPFLLFYVRYINIISWSLLLQYCTSPGTGGTRETIAAGNKLICISYAHRC